MTLPKISGEPPMDDVEIEWLWGYFMVAATLGQETVPMELFRRCLRHIKFTQSEAQAKQ